MAEALLASREVDLAGLGARDALRLEAGLCLYGSDIDEETSPVEAGLAWAIQKVRRMRGAREGGFPGADRILSELRDGPARRRVGLLPEGRAPVRGGAALFAAEEGGAPVGHVTSGTFGPTLGAPCAMGYVPTTLGAAGTRLFAEVRGKRLPVTVAAMPFVPTRYRKA
jgi:aminomethyltransferase